jgi:hypothetical protein
MIFFLLLIFIGLYFLIVPSIKVSNMIYLIASYILLKISFSPVPLINKYFGVSTILILALSIVFLNVVWSYRDE